MRTVVVLFTRDLRVHDNPALATAAATADQVVPLFVIDPSLKVPANRRRFLLESLSDLRHHLRALGGDLMVRTGDPVAQAIRVAKTHQAIGIAASADYSAYAQARQRRLADACEQQRIGLRLFDAVTVVAPKAIQPTSGADHYQVFTPYWRAWQSSKWRRVADTPARIVTPALDSGVIEEPSHHPHWTGGEPAALARLERFTRRAAGYAEGHDDLAGDHTSRLSPYLHFGCLSPLALANADLPEAFRRQLCWRDFYHQLLAAFPKLTTHAYRVGAHDTWKDDAQALERWKHGQTGVAIVDAGMSQLLREGWMHNRARMITASYLTKTLGLDWRAGAEWFAEHLVDADIANNYGNWQWVAGTGTDTKPYRRFSPSRQAERFDPDRKYIERYRPG